MIIIITCPYIVFDPKRVIETWKNDVDGDRDIMIIHYNCTA